MIEDAIVGAYASLRFPSDLADTLRTRMAEAIKEEEECTRLLNEQLGTELARLERQEENLIDLAAGGGLDIEKIKRRIATVQRQKDAIRERLGDGRRRLEIGVELIEDALTLLSDPEGLYRRMSHEQRRLLNQAVFDKLYVYPQERIDKVALRPPFDELMYTREAARPLEASDLIVVDPGKQRRSQATLTGILLDRGSNKPVMVGAEVSGIRT